MIKKYLIIILLPWLFTSLHADQKGFRAEEIATGVDNLDVADQKALPIIEEKDGLGRTPLHYAAYSGSEKSVETFLAYGASINAQDNQGNSPLNFLCTKKDFSNLSLITLMIQNGADIELADNNGWCPLHKAVLYSNAGVVAKLIECGASLTPLKDNMTVLHLAAQNNADHSIVEVLLKAYTAASKK